MKVSELIHQLQTLSPEFEVLVWDGQFISSTTADVSLRVEDGSILFEPDPYDPPEEPPRPLTGVRHQWKQLVLTVDEAKKNPWALFGEMPLASDGSYSGPDVQAWHKLGHGGPECEVCGLRFCGNCESDRWVLVALGNEPADCSGVPS